MCRYGRGERSVVDPQIHTLPMVWFRCIRSVEEAGMNETERIVRMFHECWDLRDPRSYPASGFRQ